MKEIGKSEDVGDAAVRAFWSYVHADDEAEGGRICRLARDVVAQYQLLTGEAIELFLDRDDIKWGDAWRDRIDSSIQSAAFFVPVLTPRFFMSPECLREFQLFARQATELGVTDLVLPLHYVNVPALSEDELDSDLVALVREFQWEDWRKLRLEDINSTDYRTAVVRLAERIAEANREADKLYTIQAAGNEREGPSTELDEPPGFLDRVASAEEALPKWRENMEALTRDIEQVADIARAGTEDIKRGDSVGSGYAARLRIARRMAGELAQPAERILARGDEFASLLHNVDDGVRVMIQQGLVEAEESEHTRNALCEFFRSLRTLSQATNEGLAQVRGMIESFAPAERASRDLRPPLRKMRQGLTRMVEAGRVSDEWIQLMETSGLNCPDNDLKSAEQGEPVPLEGSGAGP